MIKILMFLFIGQKGKEKGYKTRIFLIKKAPDFHQELFS